MGTFGAPELLRRLFCETREEVVEALYRELRMQLRILYNVSANDASRHFSEESTDEETFLEDEILEVLRASRRTRILDVSEEHALLVDFPFPGC